MLKALQSEISPAEHVRLITIFVWEAVGLTLVQRGQLGAAEFTGNIIGYACSVVCGHGRHASGTLNLLPVDRLRLYIYTIRLVMAYSSLYTVCRGSGARHWEFHHPRVTSVSPIASLE